MDTQAFDYLYLQRAFRSVDIRIDPLRSVYYSVTSEKARCHQLRFLMPETHTSRHDHRTHSHITLTENVARDIQAMNSPELAKLYDLVGARTKRLVLMARSQHARRLIYTEHFEALYRALEDEWEAHIGTRITDPTDSYQGEWVRPYRRQEMRTVRLPHHQSL